MNWSRLPFGRLFLWDLFLSKCPLSSLDYLTRRLLRGNFQILELNLFSDWALFGELGEKTAGYLPGYGLDKEIVARVGLIFGKNSLSQKTTTEDNIVEKYLRSNSEKN